MTNCGPLRFVKRKSVADLVRETMELWLAKRGQF